MRAATQVKWIADSWGIPAPEITRVVQIEPAPTPTLIASAPAPASAITPSSVTTLPAITGRSGHPALMRSIAFTTPAEWPWAVSMTTASTPRAASASTRSSRSSPTPTPAATRRRPLLSRVALGKSWRFWMSFTVISPASWPSSSTSGSFSMRCCWSSALAASRSVPTAAVTSPSEVMKSRTGRRKSFASQNLMSRLVRMPTRRPSGAVIGTPEKRNCCISASASARVASGPSVTGSVIIPLCERLTRCTSAAWSSIVRLRCSTPMPPSRATAIAMRASVTLSIAADTSGTASSMSAANVALVSTVSGSTSL